MPFRPGSEKLGKRSRPALARSGKILRELFLTLGRMSNLARHGNLFLRKLNPHGQPSKGLLAPHGRASKPMSCLRGTRSKALPRGLLSRQRLNPRGAQLPAQSLAHGRAFKAMFRAGGNLLRAPLRGNRFLQMLLLHGVRSKVLFRAAGRGSKPILSLRGIPRKTLPRGHLSQAKRRRRGNRLRVESPARGSLSNSRLRKLGTKSSAASNLTFLNCQNLALPALLTGCRILAVAAMAAEAASAEAA